MLANSTRRASRGSLYAILALVALPLAISGCKGGSKAKKGNDPGATKVAKKPAIATLAPRMQGEVAKKMRHVVSSPEKIAEGKRLYAQCGACHGDNGVGRLGIGPRLNSDTFLSAASDELLIRTITHGRTGTTMIAWRSLLTQSQIHSIVAYIRSLAPKKVVAKLNEKPLKGDLKRGAHVFRSICAGCHGRAGGGYQETANGTGIGRRAFLNSVSNGFLRYIIRAGKSQTRMRPFAGKNKVAVANLNAQQIDDVIVYMRTRAW